ncbi:MAG: hypothetical protein C0505_09985 [Leptothrix sp. (in: Bacteria)]|nr:hypothetical protein [Leptothrix sp. (in: b-proteobacteria)]
MFKRIMIVVEPEPLATAAQRDGLALAAACDAEIVYFGPLSRYRPSLAEFQFPEMAAPAQPQVDARALASQLLAQAMRQAEKAGVRSRSVIAPGDDEGHGILAAAKAARCDVIAVATAGDNAVMRLLTGSVVPGLITASTLPVLVCEPAPGRGDSEGARAERRILVVLDDRGDVHDAITQPALSHGLGLAAVHAAEVLLVHRMPPEVVAVVDMSGFVAECGDRMAAEMRERSQRLLERAQEAAGDAGIAAQVLSLPAGCTAKDIAHLATEQHCDLIVATTEGRNALMHMITGSLIPGLITAARVPVLVVRESDETQAR